MIKFRGIRKDNGKEVFGGYLKEKDNIFLVEPAGCLKHPICWPVIPESLAQYTTINDKSNVEIYGSVEYEKGKMSRGGDICKAIWQVDRKTTVIGMVKYYGRFALYALENEELSLTSPQWDTLEVIGSAYTNPELLEGS